MTGRLCRFYLRQLMAYLDNEISERARRELLQHLATCEQCQAVLNARREEFALAEKLPRRALSDGFTARVMARLQREATPMTFRRPVFTFARAALATASLAVLAVFFGLNYFSGSQTVSPPAVNESRPTPIIVESIPTPLASITPETNAASGARPTTSTGVRKVVRAASTGSTDLLELASQQEQSGQWEEALVTYQKAADQEAVRYDALLAMGRIYETMGFPIAAIEAFDEALATQIDTTPGNRRNEG